VSLTRRRPDAAAPPASRPWALANLPAGCLVELNMPFVALARSEWPAMQSALLPAALRERLERGEDDVGRRIVIEATESSGLHLLSARPRSALDRLGRRESMVLMRFADGESHKEIAARFGTSPATVRNQIARLYRKLGVHNRVELIQVVRAMREAVAGTDWVQNPPLPPASRPGGGADLGVSERRGSPPARPRKRPGAACHASTPHRRRRSG